MNKRFFTLMAAVMLAGAPFASEAFAADVSYGTALPQATPVALANGVQFKASMFLSYASGVYTPISGTGTAPTYTFTVTNFANKTFGLTVTDGANTGVLKTASDETVFVAKLSGAVATTTYFDELCTYEFAGAGTSIASSLSPATTNDIMDQDELNAFLSGYGFKLNFPGVAVKPDVNPFDNQMIAVNASATTVYFVVNDDAGKKFKAAPSGATMKDATFIVVDPYANFGITGLTVDNGEGFGFARVKGEKLVAANNKAKGEINVANAVFKVTESDQLNAADEFEITVTPEIVTEKGTSATRTVYVGAYSLTAGGLKSYVTTVAAGNVTKLTKASTASDNFVAAADVLKASKTAAVYNIFFQGNDGSQGLSDSYYGKYLVADATDTVAIAPNSVDLNLGEAQWVVTSVGAKGLVKVKNVYNDYEVALKMYKTAEAGVYQASFATTPTVAPKGAGIIRLVPAAQGESFLTISDAQLKREAGIVFVGNTAVTVDNIYPYVYENKAVSPSTYWAMATKNANAATTWNFEKKSEIARTVNFAYLDGSTIKEDKVESKIVTYNLFTKNLGLNASGQLTDATSGVWAEFAFRKNVDGSCTVMAYTPSSAYTTLIAGTTPVLAVDRTNAFIDASSAAGTPTKEYNRVKIDFAELGESLEVASRHATIEGIEGGVSMVEFDGIYNAIVAAQPMTFWLDTAESKSDYPKFYISKGIAKDEEPATKAADAETRLFMYNPTDSVVVWNPNKAQYDTNYDYLNNTNDVIAIFRPAALVAVDTLSTVQNGKSVLVSKKDKAGVCEGGLSRFQFSITKDADVEDAFVVTNDEGKYLYNLNGLLGFTTDPDKAMLVQIGEGDATANETIAAESGIEVIGGQGVVTVQGAAGKVITVANILGQTIANQVAASDNVTIAAPAGIVVVSVDGEATKVIVK